jgi:hypothetical protein
VHTAHLGVDLPGARRAGAVVSGRTEREASAGVEHVRGGPLLPERAALAEPRLDVPVGCDSGERARGRGEVGLDGLALCGVFSDAVCDGMGMGVPSGGPDRRRTRTRSCSRQRC